MFSMLIHTRPEILFNIGGDEFRVRLWGSGRMVMSAEKSIGCRMVSRVMKAAFETRCGGHSEL
jgi:hypothetical protein